MFAKCNVNRKLKKKIFFILFESQIGLNLRENPSKCECEGGLRCLMEKRLLNGSERKKNAMENRFYKSTKIIYSRKRQL